jgi:hypothetical protein
MDGICPSWNAHPIMTVVETISSMSDRKLQLSKLFPQEILMASDFKTPSRLKLSSRGKMWEATEPKARNRTGSSPVFRLFERPSVYQMVLGG